MVGEVAETVVVQQDHHHHHHKNGNLRIPTAVVVAVEVAVAQRPGRRVKGKELQPHQHHHRRR